MTEVHLMTRSDILKQCLVNNIIPTPSTEAKESGFVVWPFNKPKPLPASPTPLCILNLVFHSNASILFAVCVGC
jgi:hypothetical protein